MDMEDCTIDPKYNIRQDVDVFELLYQCIKCEFSEKIDIFKNRRNRNRFVETNVKVLNINRKCIYIEISLDPLIDSGPYFVQIGHKNRDVDTWSMFSHTNLDAFVSKFNNDFLRKKVSEFINILGDEDYSKLNCREFNTESDHFFRTDYAAQIKMKDSIGIVTGKKANKNYTMNELMVELAKSASTI